LSRFDPTRTVAPTQTSGQFPDSTSPVGQPATAHTRPISESPILAERAAELLRTPQAVMPLSVEEARCIVAYMRLVPYPNGATLFRAGERSSSNFMLFLLEGEVSVQAGGGATDAVEIAVLGPGSIIGEMALLDSSPRSATCTAVSPVKAAGLGRRGLEYLIEEHPKVAAKFLIGLSQRIGDRLRAMDDQIQIYAQLNASLQQQLDQARTKGRASA
jgi:CRP-like cAMP-binding protein